MSKKKYVLYTEQIVTQTWVYEFEADEGLDYPLQYVYENGIEGRRLSNDRVNSEMVKLEYSHGQEEIHDTRYS